MQPCNLFVSFHTRTGSRRAPTCKFTGLCSILWPKLRGRSGAVPGASRLPGQPRRPPGAAPSPLPTRSPTGCGHRDTAPRAVAPREGRLDLRQHRSSTRGHGPHRLLAAAGPSPRLPAAGMPRSRPHAPFPSGARTPPLLCSGGRRNRHLCGVAPTYRLTKPRPAAGRERGRLSRPCPPPAAPAATPPPLSRHARQGPAQEPMGGRERPPASQWRPRRGSGRRW